MNHSMRRAALTLHALSDRDQRWLLERLPVRQSGTLRGLLHELQSLGIPADMLPGIEGANDAAHALAETAAAEEAHVDMDRARVWAQKEADWAVAQTLSAMRPGIRAELLAALDIDRRQRLEKLSTEILPLKGLSGARLLANAYAAIRETAPMGNHARHQPARKGVATWLRSFVRRA